MKILKAIKRAFRSSGPFLIIEGMRDESSAIAVLKKAGIDFTTAADKNAKPAAPATPRLPGDSNRPTRSM